VSTAASEPNADRASVHASARVAELFERHGRMVLGICRAMLRDAHEAEDATQQTFLSVHRAVLAGTTTRDAGAWVAAIARNECRARIVTRMRTPVPQGDDVLAALPDGSDDLERRRQAEELVTALGALPDRQREAVVLRYLHGLRYGEVATALGLSRPATEALLFRARRAMRVRLRHVSGAALVVPLSLRNELASVLPGFDDESGAAAGVGFAGGLLAKLAAAPTAAKIATAAVAVSAVGAVGTMETNSSQRDTPESARALEAVATPSRIAAPGLAVGSTHPLTRRAVGSEAVSSSGPGAIGLESDGEVTTGGRGRDTGGTVPVTVVLPVATQSGDRGPSQGEESSAPVAAAGSQSSEPPDSEGEGSAGAQPSEQSNEGPSVEADRSPDSVARSDGDSSGPGSGEQLDSPGDGSGSGSSGSGSGSSGSGSGSGDGES
jgi:RNA polymerase sigma factor (sigma-70 family)